MLSAMDEEIISLETFVSSQRFLLLPSEERAELMRRLNNLRVASWAESETVT